MDKNDSLIGIGFITLVVSLSLCGAAALKYLIVAPAQPYYNVSIDDRDTRTITNRCYIFCRAGGQP